MRKKKLVYRAIPEMTPEAVEAAIWRNVQSELIDAALSPAYHPDDAAWAQDVGLRLVTHSDPVVRYNALVGLGLVARFLGKLDQARVQPVLEAALQDPDEMVRDEAKDTIETIELLLGWRVGRSDPAGRRPSDGSV